MQSGRFAEAEPLRLPTPQR